MILKILMFSLYVWSCDDDSGKMGLSGTWKLVSFECCDVPIENYIDNAAIWKFDEQKQQLTIQNKIKFDASSQYTFTDEGVFSYT